jgi:hypothetical protein
MMLRRGGLLVLALLAGCGRESEEPPEARPAERHVQLVHLDGFRSDLARSLLEVGRLPNLRYLVSRGRVCFETATVDKSETMKVIQSYLTSRLDTSVVGWWQFDRSDFRFRNYWLDPAEVLNYALGLKFPLRPTIQDFLAARGENLVAGMSLVRRGVPFDNYARAYVEGASAVSTRAYHRQAHATMEGFLKIQRRIAENGEPSPALSSLLLAAADEFAHAEGVTSWGDESRQRCVSRDEMDATLFDLVEEAGNPELEKAYFTDVRRDPLRGRVESLCVELPRVGNGRAHPHYVLSMLLIDMELGRLIEQLRSQPVAGGGSLFDQTLFIIFGDHGMVDTPHGMIDGGRQSSASLGEGFLAYLDRRLGLETPEDARPSRAGREIGIDFEHLPKRLTDPERYVEWQSDALRETTEGAERWAEGVFADLRELLRSNLHDSYWWLFFLRSLLIDPKLDAELDPVSNRAVAVLRQLYLRGLPEYRDAEALANRDFFDEHVRLVYGGGARNNAELFLPACEGIRCSWERRPTYEQIVGFRNGRLLEALMDNPGVGLVFIRQNNEAHTSEVPEETRIEVRDRRGFRGVIRVRRDAVSGELVFHYRTDPASPEDPLGYGEWGAGDGTYGTYNEWNDRSLKAGSRGVYANVVGGIGAYLHSDNPAIGDVLVTAAPDWNFGDNRGGHGGVLRDEKTTFLLVSGPDVRPGELRARARWRTREDGSIVEASGDDTHLPTLLDIAPTTLTWLGYDRDEVTSFGRDGFRRYLEQWIRSQRQDILSHLDGMDSLDKARAESGMEQLSLTPLKPEIERLLLFVDSDVETTLGKLDPRPMMGNELVLR